MKIAGKRNDASSQAELFEDFDVQKDHDAKPRSYFRDSALLSGASYKLREDRSVPKSRCYGG
jgi:hypothetical protein